MQYIVANLQGLGSRKRQEDSFCFVNVLNERLIEEKGLFFAVCDGMGGLMDGKIASETATSYFKEAVLSLCYDADLNAQLKNICYKASLAVENQLLGKGGTTGILGMLYQEQLYFASVGDSYLYLKRGNRLLKLNEEHSLKNSIFRECVEEGILDPTEGKSHSEGYALTSYLGLPGISEIDGFHKPFSCVPGDVILCCSDGLGAFLSETEVWNVLHSYAPQEACKVLEHMLIEKKNPNQDNYTSIIIQCI